VQSARLLCPWDFPGKNTGVSCHFLPQGNFPTQESNPPLLHWQEDFLPLSHRKICISTYLPSVAAACDQGKWTLRVALSQDLKTSGDDRLQTLVIQAVLNKENILSDTTILCRIPLL